jgi:hypothetical protein
LLVLFYRYGFPYRKLYVDNGQQNWDQYLTLAGEADGNYHFHELHLTNNASLHMVAGQRNNLTVVKVI